MERTEDRVEELIVKHGGKTFSTFVGLMLILALCSRCWWFYMIPWYIQEPVYTCVFADPSMS